MHRRPVDVGRFYGRPMVLVPWLFGDGDGNHFHNSFDFLHFIPGVLEGGEVFGLDFEAIPKAVFVVQ